MYTYRPEELPCLTEWKMLNEGEYVLGIEPGTTYPIGRGNGRLETLEPGEVRNITLRIEILDGIKAIHDAEKRILL